MRLALFLLLLSGCRHYTADVQTPRGLRCAINCERSVECLKGCPGVYVREVRP